MYTESAYRLFREERGERKSKCESRVSRLYPRTISSNIVCLKNRKVCMQAMMGKGANYLMRCDESQWEEVPVARSLPDNRIPDNWTAYCVDPQPKLANRWSVKRQMV